MRKLNLKGPSLFTMENTIVVVFHKYPHRCLEIGKILLGPPYQGVCEENYGQPLMLLGQHFEADSHKFLY